MAEPSYASILSGGQSIRLVRTILTWPSVGTWVADVQADKPYTVDTSPFGVRLTFGRVSLVGTVYRQRSIQGSLSMRIVGGAGGWGRAVAGKQYASAAGLRRSLVASQLAASVGERVEVPQDAVVGTLWCQLAGKASAALSALWPTWYVDASGSTRLADRAKTVLGTAYEITALKAAAGRYTVYAADPSVFTPDVDMLSPQLDIQSVIHRIEASHTVEILAT